MNLGSWYSKTIETQKEVIDSQKELNQIQPWYKNPSTYMFIGLGFLIGANKKKLF